MNERTSNSQTRLLLLSCSQSKDPRSDLLSPLQRYTGHFFRIIAKARREGYWPDDVVVGVISAHYGFLPSTRRIAWYEERLNRAHALALCDSIGSDLDAFLKHVPYQQVFVAMGKIYRLTLSSSCELTRLDRDGKVVWASGGIGMMLQQTRSWLLQSAEKPDKEGYEGLSDKKEECPV